MSATVPAVDNSPLVQAMLDGDLAGIQELLGGRTLLVPACETPGGEVAIEVRRGASGRKLMFAFTDFEALAAWDRNPPGNAVALDAAAVAALNPDAMIALNPAGPGAHLLDARILTGAGAAAADATTSSDSRADSDHHSPAAVDPQSRRALRLRANQFHQLARHTAATGDYAAACEQLRPALDACDELDDRLHGAAAELELARWRAKSGSTRLALGGWREAAETLAALGELDLALDALMDAARAAADEGLSADAERLSIAALDLAAGSEFSDRLVAIWRTIADGQGGQGRETEIRRGS